MSKNIQNYPVMKKQCKTCPFNKDNRGRYQDPKLVDRIKRDVLSEASQICHHPVLTNKLETHLCRGARDFQLQIFHRIEFLEEATDEAWERAKESQLSEVKQ